MRLLIIVAVATALQGCSRPSAGPALREVRMALSRDAITWLPVHLAQSLGYIEQAGLTLTVSDVPGMSKGLEALVGGSVDVTGASPVLALQLNADGRSIQAFVVLAARPNFALIVPPRSMVRSIADLKGKRLGISSPGSPTQLFVNHLLITHGLSPDDISTVSIGTGATSVAAVERDQVDVASLVGSAITTMERRYQGLIVLADSRTPEGTRAIFGSPTFPAAALVADAQWLQENADTAHRLVRAVKQALHWMREHSAEEVRAQMSEAIRMADPDADVEAIREAQRSISEDGVMPPECPDTLRRVFASWTSKARAASVASSAIYTNEFAAAR